MSFLGEQNIVKQKILEHNSLKELLSHIHQNDIIYCEVTLIEMAKKFFVSLMNFGRVTKLTISEPLLRESHYGSPVQFVGKEKSKLQNFIHSFQLFIPILRQLNSVRVVSLLIPNQWVIYWNFISKEAASYYLSLLLVTHF